MSNIVKVSIHPSQFPDRVRRDLLESLRTRRINHKFHYDTYKQARKWLALHEAYSPARTDPDCAAIYDAGYQAAAKQLRGGLVHVVGLGCGGGQKDTQLLKLLREAGRQVSYTPCDSSVPLVLTARNEALSQVAHAACHPLVCDVGTADDLTEVLEEQTVSAAWLITFFGMIPNFEPRAILPRLAGLVRPADLLLFSANLAPGPDYAAGVQRVLPQYDNELTRDWLTTFLLDLGVKSEDGTLRFAMETDADGLLRIAAHFHFTRLRGIQLDQESIDFGAGESIRLFFSYRHTPATIRSLLGGRGLKVVEQWITKSEEEGIFLCRMG